MKIVPADPTIKDMKQEAQECDQRAKTAAEPLATRLREKAELLREWMKLLSTGAWNA
jgi:hypothetical protein